MTGHELWLTKGGSGSGFFPLRFLAIGLLMAGTCMGVEPLHLINLGGSDLLIGGRQWKAGPAAKGKGMARFENQNVDLVPVVSGEVATMIRSSLWNGGGKNKVTVGDLGKGNVTVFLYAWEDNSAETWSVFLNGTKVLDQHNSGPVGSWRRLGPWVIEPDMGLVSLTSEGGHANWSGLEIWPGEWERHPDEAPPEPPNPVSAGEKHFDAVIAPILAKHCVECHNPSDQKGELDFTRSEGAGDSIEKGDAEGSEFWLQVASGDMPKKRPRVPDAEQKQLREWLESGAQWSRTPIDPYMVSTEKRAGYDWWSLQPVVRPVVPAMGKGMRGVNEIDAFVGEELKKHQLDFSSETDRRTLLRRLSFDLTGLPPDVGRMEELLADVSEKTYEAYVDELLASPAFGEHWARHWLDVVRYGESQGFERNRIRENAWRYRDWVVGAFNKSMPYDEFVRKQIAGDVLYPGDNEALLATGFLVSGTWDQVGHKEGSKAMQAVAREEHMEDMVGAVSQAFLGLTVQCARCHDHKFDPIPQRDYYQMAAVFGGVNQEDKERENVPGVGAAHLPFLRQPPVMNLLKRGNVTQPGEVVTAKGLASVREVTADWGLDPTSPEAERRKAFAEWLTDARNPLTARVMVNRVWSSVFGEGLVDTPSDFGFNGGKPSHPELLDWMASTFVNEGWKLKPLVKRLVMSATYRQQSGTKQPKALSVDAGNRLLWRAPVKRLSGEQVRDAMLAVSGTLNAERGGSSFRDVKVKMGNNHEFTDPANDFSDGSLRRTIYRLWAHSGGHPLLDGLDCPVPGVTTPKRASTITPLQALSLLNDPFCDFVANKFAERLSREAGDGVEDRIQRAWLLAFGRKAKPDEVAMMADFVTKQGWEQACLVVLNTNEFLFIK